MKTAIRKYVRPVAGTISAPVLGFFLIFTAEQLFNFELSKLLSALINLVITAIFAFFLFPKKFGVPFGKINTAEFLQKLGFYFPPRGWQHVGLGLLLALCTLSGMLIASLITGEYVLDFGTINLPHLVFSLNPALWEELFYRGILMVLLIKFTGSMKKAAVLQIVLFGLTHFKGFGLWEWIDILTVMVLAIGFTYTAYKTRTLLAGIIFHYFHDAFLFFVQVPSGTSLSNAENLTFFSLLWLMVGLGCLITKLLTERYNLQAGLNFYDPELT